MCKVTVDRDFIKTVDFNKVNSLDLRSDLENNNIYGCDLVAEGYIGNRPSDFVGEHEDDTWAIEVGIGEDDGGDISYLYTSEYEYNQDLKTLGLTN